MLSLVLIETQNVPIPTLKIRPIQYYASVLWTQFCICAKLDASKLHRKAQAVNKAQRKLTLKLYLPGSFKSQQALFNSWDFKCTNIKDFTKFTIISCYKNSSLKERKIQDGMFLLNSRPSKTRVLNWALLGSKQRQRPGFTWV